MGPVVTAASGRRLMSAPGIGAIIALTLHPSGRARPWAGHPALLCIMEPLLAARAALREQLILIVFSRETVAKADQVTPRKYHSGEMDRAGAISRAGDALVRVALFEAAHVIMTRSPKCSKIKAWAMNVTKRRGPSGPRSR